MVERKNRDRYSGVSCRSPGCGTLLLRNELRCRRCGVWSAPAGSGEEDTVILSQARVHNQRVPRVPMGFFTPLFGVGGLAVTSTNLIGGAPGAGKSTMFLMCCDCALDHFPTGEALYVACEQSADELGDTAERIRMRQWDRVRVVRALGGLQRTLDDLFRAYRPVLLVLDSISALVRADHDMAVTVLKRIKEFAVGEIVHGHRCPALISNQINGDGDMAGHMAMQHEVDGTFMFVKDDLDHSRYLYSTKNRFGMQCGVEMRMSRKDENPPGILQFVGERT